MEFGGYVLFLLFAILWGGSRHAVLRRKKPFSFIANRHRYQLDQIPGMAFECVADEHYTPLYISAGSLALTGYKPEDLVKNGISLASLIYPPDRQAVSQSLQEQIRQDGTYRIRYRILRHPDQKIIWVFDQGRAIYDKSGKISHIEGFIADITENAESEIRLRERIKELRCLYSITAMTTSHTPLHKVFQESLQYIREGLQFPEQAHIRIQYQGTVYETPGFLTTDYALKASIDFPLPGQGEIEIYYSSGTIKDKELIFLPEEKELLMSIALQYNEMLQRITIEKEIKASRKQLTDILKAASEVSVIATDTNGIIQVFNTGAERMLGYTAREIVGIQTPVMIHDPAEVQARGQELSAQYKRPVQGFEVFVLNTEQQGPERREWTYIRKDGRRITVSLVVSPVRSDNGEITGYLGIATDITERKAAEQALQENERRLSFAISATSDAIWEWNYQTGETYYSPRWYEMLGFKHEHFPMTFDTWQNLCHPGDVDAVISMLSTTLSNPESGGYEAEFRMKNSNGEWVWILGRGAVVSRDSRGQALLLAGTHTDITARKKSEQDLLAQEEKYRLLFENMNNGFILAGIDVQSKNGQADIILIDANPAFHKMLRRKDKNLAGIPLRSVLPSVYEQLSTLFNGSQREQTSRIEIYAPELERSFQLHTFPAGHGRIAIMMYDISDRKKAQEELQRSMRQLEDLAGNIPGVIFQFYYLPNGQMGTSYLSKKAEELFGAKEYSNDAMALLLNGLTEEDKRNLMVTLSAAISKKEKWCFEAEYHRPDGSILWLSGESIPQYANDTIIYNGVLLDITERKLAEQAARNSQIQLREIAENVPGALFDAFFDEKADFQIAFTYISPHALDIFGVESTEKNSFLRQFTACLPEADLALFLESIDIAFNNRTQWKYEGRFIRPDGGIIWFEGSALPNERDGRLMFTGVLLDITRRKEAEIAVSEKENFLDIVYSGVHYGIVVADPLTDGDFLFAGMNKAQANLMRLHLKGLHQNSFDGLKFSELKQFPGINPSSIEKTIEHLKECMEKQTLIEYEEKAVMPDGTIKVARERFSPIFDQDGRVIRIITTTFDDTERVLALEELRKNEKFLNSIFMGSTIGLVVIDPNQQGELIISGMNPAASVLMNTKPELLLGKSMRELKGIIPPAAVDTLVPELLDCVKTGQVMEIERSDFRGLNLFFRTIYTPLKNEQGNVFRIIVSVEDMTQKRNAIVALSQNEQFLNTIFSSVSYGIMVVEPAGDSFRFIRMNPTYEHLMHVSSQSLEGKVLEEMTGLVPQSALDFTRAKLEECRDTGSFVEYERAAIRNNEWSCWLTRLTPLFAEDGTLLRIIVTTTDVTKRAAAENALKSIVTATASVTGSDYFTSLVLTLSDIAQAEYVFIAEYNPSTDNLQTLAFAAHGQIQENRTFMLENSPCLHVMANKTCFIPEKVQTLYPGNQSLASLNIESYYGVPLFSNNGIALGTLVLLSTRPMNQDPAIASMMNVVAARVATEIERQKAVNQLIREKEFANAILDSSPAIICMLDMDGTTLSVNEIVESITGYTPAELIGQNWWDILYPGDLIAEVERLRSVMANQEEQRSITMTLQAKSGERKVLQWRGSVLMNEHAPGFRMLAVGADITKQQQYEQEQSILERLRRDKKSLEMRNELLRLSQIEHFSIDDALQEILPAMARHLQSEFVSYWEFDASEKGIKCLKQYCCSKNKDIPEIEGAILSMVDFPEYFDIILHSELPLSAPNAREHPATHGFTESYFIPNNIFALLDLPVWHAGQVKGVICVEDIDQPREWTTDEIDFSASIARTISLKLDALERQSIIRQLQQSEERFLSAFHTSPVAMMLLDQADESRILDVNDAYCQAFNWKKEDLLFNRLQDIQQVHFFPSHQTEYINREMNEKGMLWGMEVNMQTMDGKDKYFILSISQIHMHDKPQLLIVLQEITEKVIMQARMEEALHMAEEASRAKSEFLANMSHEIRTPMNAILGFTDILREQIRDPRHKKHLDTIAASGRTLLALINDILDLSKIEAGKLQLSIEPLHIRSVMEEVQAMFSAKAEEKGLEFVLHVEPNVPASLLLDEVRLRQILFNLIGNAVKFTDAGYIAVAARTRSLTVQDFPDDQFDTNQITLVLEITDTGIGIAPGQKEYIFESFRQQEGQSTRKYGGTGLGLTITRRLVEAMNGYIQVESTVGQGSVFRVIIPHVMIGEDSHTELVYLPEEYRDIDFGGASVLIVDDIAANRELLKSYLENVNIMVHEAENGQQAVEKSLLIQANSSIILMDLRMPIMNGLDATQKIKENVVTKNIPVIAVTASGMVHEEEKIKGICDGFLRKPVKKVELMDYLCRYLPFTFTDSKAFPQDEYLMEDVFADAEDKVHREELKNLLRREMMSEWERVSQLPIISQIKGFALQLQEKTQSDTLLNPYAQQLLSACEQFDIQAVKRLLRKFPEILS
jgi:PAS domain S-box-containing protein